jgi:hypothetical protein
MKGSMALELGAILAVALFGGVIACGRPALAASATHQETAIQPQQAATAGEREGGGLTGASPSAPTPEAAKQGTEKLAISPEELMKPWTGDLDGMIERGFIRVLTVYSKTFYFVNKGVQMGGVADIFRIFE